MSQTTIIRSVGGYIFDASFVEQHESELEICENPLEVGVVIADHAYMLPLKYQLQAGVSDTPLRVRPDDPFGQGDGSRSRTALEVLQQLQATAEPFTVVSGLRVYENMLVKKISASQDKDSAQVLMFTADFKQITRVSTQVVTYPPRKAGATKRQASAKEKKGEQQGTQPDAVKKGSLLSKIHNIFSNAAGNN